MPRLSDCSTRTSLSAAAARPESSRTPRLSDCSTRTPPHSAAASRPGVLLATCVALFIVDEFTKLQVRVLIDTGSEVSLVTNKLVAPHRLARNSTRLSITGVGGLSAETARHGVAVSLQSCMSNFRLTLNAFSIGRITSPLPLFSSSDPHWSHISGLQLADPDFLVPSDVDVLLGADVYGRLILPRVTQGRLSDPVAQETKFGWIVLGPTEDLGTSVLKSLHSSATHDDLRDALTRFWEQEEVPAARVSDLAPEDEDCERHFVTTHSRDHCGRYVVRLPLKSSPSVLGESRAIARSCLKRLQSHIARDSSYKSLYSDFLAEYERLGHMERIPGDARSRARDGALDGGMTSAHDI